MARMLEKLRTFLKIKDLRRKILFTLGIIVVYRLIANIPIAGVNIEALRRLFHASQFLGLLDMLSGGAMQRFSIGSLGLNPYINASIMLQLLGMVFPKLEEMQKEGAYGREKISQYTKYLTVPLAALQGLGVYYWFKSQGAVGELSVVGVVVFILTLIGGVMLLVWLGGLISEYGLGHGTSVIITVGILSGLPLSLGRALSVVTAESAMGFLAYLVLAIGLIAGVVVVEEGVRQIEIKYARRVVGRESYGGGNSYLPLRVNQAGVIPIIFAGSLVLIPSAVSQYLGGVSIPVVSQILTFLAQVFDPARAPYNLIYFVLVVGFTFFYTAVSFNPDRIADDIKKYGGFIPGIRPGRATSNYLNWVLTRVTLFGAFFLGAIAVLPSIVSGFSGAALLSLGGTGILIVVQVLLETLKKVEARMVMSDYEGFLK